MSVNPINVRYPFELRNQPPEVVQAHRYAFQGLVDLNQAIATLTNRINTITPSVPTKTSSSSSTTVIVNGSSFPGLGGVRDLTGLTVYTTTGSDNGILLLLNDASPVAVTLDSAMTTPYFLSVTNLGAGSATFTPSSGTINGTASFTLPQNYTSIIVFDGTNWFASALLVLPQSAGPTLHEWLAAYDPATGAFALSQPDFTDISGNLAVGQLPASVPVVSFGTGAPVGTSTEGYLYFDTTLAVYVGYVYHSGAWNQF